MSSVTRNCERRIFFLCPNSNYVLGGVKKIYQHVDILNRNGFTAFVLHTEPNFRCTWFKNDTSIAYPCWPEGVIDYNFYPEHHSLISKSEELDPINPQDIVVVPEIIAFQFTKYAAEQPYVIFSQNAYYTFNGRELPQKPFPCDNGLLSNPYTFSTLLGIITVSKDSFDCLQYLLPNGSLYRVQIAVDPDQFTYSHIKRKQIAYMPRKNSYDILQILGILIARQKLKGWMFVPIDNKTEDEVAEIMKHSWIFLSIGGMEGFGLPPLEAMFCGCLVIGYHGRGGKEYIHPPYAVSIDKEDVFSFAKAIEETVTEINLYPQAFLDKAKQISDTMREKFSQEQEEKDVLAVWKSILDKST